MEHIDQRINLGLHRIEQWFEELADPFEGLGVDVNRNRRNNRRLGADLAHSDPVNKPVSIRKQNNPLFSESSEEEEHEFSDEERADYEDKDRYTRIQRGHYDDRDRRDDR